MVIGFILAMYHFGLQMIDLPRVLTHCPLTCPREESRHSYDEDTMVQTLDVGELEQERLTESQIGVNGDYPTDLDCARVEYDMDSDGNPVGVIDIRPIEIAGDNLPQRSTPASLAVTECSNVWCP